MNINEILVNVVIAAVIFSIIGGVLLLPYFEARTFNKFTDGPKATYFDALFSELRVMSE